MLQDFNFKMKTKGWCDFKDTFLTDEMNSVRSAMAETYEHCRTWQVKQGLAHRTYGTMHHLIGQNAVLDRIVLELPILPYIKEYFKNSFILNSYGGVFNMPVTDAATQSAYIHNIHRDTKIYSSHLPLMLNVLVMVDDFTAENGATWALSGSHRCADKPDDEFFYGYAEQFLGTTGTVICFDSNLWHAAGVNHTAQPRRALTLTFTLPFCKQQMDYPRFIDSTYADTLSKEARQLLGYTSHVPSSYEEWYQPPEKRFYREVS